MNARLWIFAAVAATFIALGILHTVERDKAPVHTGVLFK